MPKLIHYRQRCIGCNACVEIAFDRWRISKKDGKAVLIGGIEKKGVFQATIRYDEVEENLRVVEACPVNVIKLDGV
ncbi:ferredoxin [Sphingobacterium rhinopitheci]|uniref:ferredoxin n=1 Tax=Sphingobacterium rhinopitheci TaxID=2781960 RepID=UPI001F51E50A|nr:ferredoxin [Sphingobacterium rhinopitheci]MCI0921166.1 ferredoxin [Sphingobacterium rhinopitheci]